MAPIYNHSLSLKEMFGNSEPSLMSHDDWILDQYLALVARYSNVMSGEYDGSQQEWDYISGLYDDINEYIHDYPDLCRTPENFNELWLAYFPIYEEQNLVRERCANLNEINFYLSPREPIGNMLEYIADAIAEEEGFGRTLSCWAEFRTSAIILGNATLDDSSNLAEILSKSITSIVQEGYEWGSAGWDLWYWLSYVREANEPNMRFLLELCGDVETNPGPVYSNICDTRYHDTRDYKIFEQKLKRKNHKSRVSVNSDYGYNQDEFKREVRERIRKIAREVKHEALAQGGYWSAPTEAAAIGHDLNANLDRVCTFLETALPCMIDNVTGVAQSTSHSAKIISDDLIKGLLCIVLICLLVETKHYKLAMAVILVVATKLFGFDTVIVDVAKELASAIRNPIAQINTEDIVFHPMFALCGKMVFLLIAVICLKKLPGKSDIDSFMRRLDTLPKAVKGTLQLQEWVSTYFDQSLDYVKGKVVGKTGAELKKSELTSIEIMEWANKVTAFVEAEQRNKIDTDLEVALEAERLYYTGLKFLQDPFLPMEMVKVVNSSLRPAKDIYKYVTQSPIRGGEWRMRPLVIVLAGESGIGKTSAVPFLCIDLNREMGEMGPDILQSSVYSRQVETEYWDGYKAQKIVVYDDAFQKKDDAVNCNLEVFEVIRACNSYPQHLHMANLSDKNTFSKAEVYIYTVNEMNVKLESLTHEQAFYNRIGENAYVVRPKLAYRKVVKSEGGREKFLLDKTKLTGDTLNLDIYEFVRMERISEHPGGWKETGEIYDYAEFSKKMCAAWRERKEEHQRTMKTLRDYAQRPVEAQMGRDAEWFNNDIAKRMTAGETITDILYDYSGDDELHSDYMAYKKQQQVPCKWEKYADRLKVVLEQGNEYIKTLGQRIANLIKEHPYISMIATIGSVLSLYGAMKWFSSGVEETFEQPEEVTIEKPKSRPVRAEMISSEQHHTARARKNHRMYVRAEGVIDETGYLVANNKVANNTYQMTINHEGKESIIGNVVFITGWVVLMPYHYVCGLAGRRYAQDTIITLSRPNLEGVIEFPMTRLFQYDDTIDGFTLSEYSARLEHEDGELVDAILTNLHGLGVRVHSDLRPKIVTVRDQASLNTSFHAILTTMSRKAPLTTAQQIIKGVKPMNTMLNVQLPIGSEIIKYTQRDCYKYYSVTVVGDCGALLVAQNHAVVRKIFAMHIAGAGENGYACPINQEMLARGMKAMTFLEARITAHMCFEKPSGTIETECRVPEGLFEPLGKAPKGVGMALKTAIRESCLHGEITEPISAPAVLHKDCLYTGLKKCGVKTTVIKEEYIAAAVNDVANIVLTQHVDHIDVEQYQRILSYEEAVQGVPFDDFLKSVTRTTSPGYPYCLENNTLPGKTKWMGTGQEFDFKSESALKLRHDVEQLLQNCEAGLIKDVIFVDTLKDERRELEKIKLKKTRVFSAGPQHFVVAFRKYFLPFSAWIMHNRIDNEIAVGTNPFSMDWHNIAMRMRSKGDRIVAGDFSNFDGSLNAQVLWAIFWKVFVPWLETIKCDKEQHESNVRVCASLWTHLVHSVHICEDNLYMWTHSQPSGNPFTVIINSLYNSTIMRVVWQYVMAKEKPQLRTMNHFNDHVAMVCYGDDNLLNISEEVINVYNQNSISEAMRWIGHEYTDETKSGEAAASRLLHEVRFLKRGFRKDPLLCRWVAPLKLDVIYEMLNWTRKGVNPDDVTMMNIDAALRETTYHGRLEFDKLKNSIQNKQNLLPVRPRILLFEEYLFDLAANEGEDQPYN